MGVGDTMKLVNYCNSDAKRTMEKSVAKILPSMDPSAVHTQPKPTDENVKFEPGTSVSDTQG